MLSKGNSIRLGTSGVKVLLVSLVGAAGTSKVTVSGAAGTNVGAGGGVSSLTGGNSMLFDSTGVL